MRSPWLSRNKCTSTLEADPDSWVFPRKPKFSIRLSFSFGQEHLWAPASCLLCLQSLAARLDSQDQVLLGLVLLTMNASYGRPEAAWANLWLPQGRRSAARAFEAALPLLLDQPARTATPSPPVPQNSGGDLATKPSHPDGGTVAGDLAAPASQSMPVVFGLALRRELPLVGLVLLRELWLVIPRVVLTWPLLMISLICPLLILLGRLFRLVMWRFEKPSLLLVQLNALVVGFGRRGFERLGWPFGALVWLLFALLAQLPVLIALLLTALGMLFFALELGFLWLGLELRVLMLLFNRLTEY